MSDEPEPGTIELVSEMSDAVHAAMDPSEEWAMRMLAAAALDQRYLFYSDAEGGGVRGDVGGGLLAPNSGTSVQWSVDSSNAPTVPDN